MKAFFSGLLGVLLGIVFFLVCVYLLIRYILNKTGFKGMSLKELYQNYKDASLREMVRHKQVSGMTKVLLPTILSDFPDFNEKQFYSETEKGIRMYLQALEEKEASLLSLQEYLLLFDKVSLEIQDLVNNEISYRYDDILFHKHAIKSYKRTKGMIKLEISTALEYYYQKMRGEKVLISSDYKKQTRYTTTFVYVHDTVSAGFDVRVLGLTCPNCGGPIQNIESKMCSYCQSGLNMEVANLLKCWRIIEIKDDYQ